MKKQIRLLVEGLFDDIYDLNNDVNDINDLGNELNKFNYKYHPKDFKELRHLVKQLLNERGKDADLNDIDVSQLTTFYGKDTNGDYGLFERLDPHNIDISQWDVSNVENMRCMFHMCINFNCDLSYWDVSNVKDMRVMFAECKKFDCDLSNWNVSNVRDMDNMFDGCISLKNIPSWYKINK